MCSSNKRDRRDYTINGFILYSCSLKTKQVNDVTTRKSQRVPSWRYTSALAKWAPWLPVSGHPARPSHADINYNYSTGHWYAFVSLSSLNFLYPCLASSGCVTVAQKKNALISHSNLSFVRKHTLMIGNQIQEESTAHCNLDVRFCWIPLQAPAVLYKNTFKYTM